MSDFTYNKSAGIPVRCFSCGRVIGNKYAEYIALLSEKNEKNTMNTTMYDYANENANNKEIIEKLGLNLYCCYKTLQTHPSNLTNYI